MKTMHISLGIALLGTVLLSGCNSYSSGSSNNNATVDALPQVVLFSDLSRAALAQDSTSEPVRLNGLTIENDVTSIEFYNSLFN
jgi:outer membrane murein-binding lipoprotein Lpp